jgi:hypothetical protein
MATAVIPSFLHEAMTRHAISPRFATRTLVIFGFPWESVGNGGKFNKFPVFCTVMLNVFSSPTCSSTGDEDVKCAALASRLGCWQHPGNTKCGIWQMLDPFYSLHGVHLNHTCCIKHFRHLQNRLAVTVKSRKF